MSEVTRILSAIEDGDESAARQLLPLVYEELRRLARTYMRKERRTHSLQATALVNEAFIRLVDARAIDWQDRAHFFAVSAKMMRRVLVDAARAKASAKRGGRVERVDHSTAVNLDQFPATPADVSAQLCALDDALNTLAAMDARRAQVVELRYFGGLSVEETAAALGISERTVKREWKMARAWLYNQIGSAKDAAE